MNSAIFEASVSAGVRRCVEWLACHVDMKARMCDSTSGPSVYRGYGYGMMSYSRSSGRTGKGFGSGWVTSGGLDGVLVGNQLSIECPVVRIALGKPPIAREMIGQ